MEEEEKPVETEETPDPVDETPEPADETPVEEDATDTIPFDDDSANTLEISSEMDVLMLIADNLYALWITLVVLGVIYIFNSFVRRS